MQLTKALLGATVAALIPVSAFAIMACGPGGPGGDDAGGGVVEDKYCTFACAAASDCVIDGTVEADWTCETEHCVFVHYFADGTYCANDNDCHLNLGGAFKECTAAGDCPNQVCAKGYSNSKAYCLTAPIPGTFECSAIGASWVEYDTTDIDDADVTVCVNGEAVCSADKYCMDPTVDAGPAEEAATCEGDDECDADEKCLAPL